MHWNKCQNKHVRVSSGVSAEWTVCNQLHLSVRALVPSRGLEVWSVSCPLRPPWSWHRLTERCPVLDVCCLLLHLDPPPCHVSSFPPQRSVSAGIYLTPASLCCHPLLALPAASQRPMKVSLTALCSSDVLFLSLHNFKNVCVSLSHPLVFHVVKDTLKKSTTVHFCLTLKVYCVIMGRVYWQNLILRMNIVYNCYRIKFVWFF